MNLKRIIIRIFSGFILLLLLIPIGSEAGVGVIGGLSRKREVKAGETYRGIVIIRNTGEAPQEVKVYQTDYLFFFDGRNLYGEPGKTPRSNANWITFSRSRVTIPPQETVSVYYTAKVPDDPSLAGTYWSILMVEPIPESHPQAAAEEGKVKIGITQLIRYGIQFITHIGDSGSRKIKFLDRRLIKKGGKRILQIDIENIGERLLTPSVWAELYSEAGLAVGRFKSGRLSIYPGTSVRHRIDLTGLPKGRYKTLVVVDNGDRYVFGAQYKLEF